jgi:cell division septum initiation protein DivIVA
MLKLSIPTFLRNAASAWIGRRGAVTEQARQAGCSRQTVYDHAQQLRQRVEEGDRRLEQAQAECRTIQEDRQRLLAQLRQSVTIDQQALQRFAVTSQAMGISLRQAEELLGKLLPADRVPDHATMGRWTALAGRRAGAVLAMLDPVCAPAVQTLCVDEIFFGG